MTNGESEQSKTRLPSAPKQPKFVGIPDGWETMTDDQQNKVVGQILETLFGPFPEQESE